MSEGPWQGMGKGILEREGAMGTKLTPPRGSYQEPGLLCSLVEKHTFLGDLSSRGRGAPKENIGPSTPPPRIDPSQCFQSVSFSRQMCARLGWTTPGTFAFHGSLNFSFPDLYLKQAMMDGHAYRKTNSWSSFIYAKNPMQAESLTYNTAN